jgi:hypothetical protein
MHGDLRDFSVASSLFLVAHPAYASDKFAYVEIRSTKKDESTPRSQIQVSGSVLALYCRTV